MKHLLDRLGFGLYWRRLGNWLRNWFRLNNRFRCWLWFNDGLRLWYRLRRRWRRWGHILCIHSRSQYLCDVLRVEPSYSRCIVPFSVILLIITKTTVLCSHECECILGCLAIIALAKIEMGTQDTVGHISCIGNPFIVFLDIDCKMIEAKLQVLARNCHLHFVCNEIISLLHFKPQYAIRIVARHCDNAWIGEVIVLSWVESIQFPCDHHVLTDAHTCKDLVFWRLIICNNTICVFNFY